VDEQARRRTYYRQWKRNGLIEELHEMLRDFTRKKLVPPGGAVAGMLQENTNRK
jgi:hypothetical protein